MALSVACGRTVPIAEGPVLKVRAPSFVQPSPVLETLEPPPPPTPSLSPTTPPTPLEAPRGASLQAASGSQPGSPSTWCWNRGDGRATCRDQPQAEPAPPLAVRRGERITLRLHADAPPSELSLRPFQGSRDGVPSQRLEPVLVHPLEIDLGTGEWSLDACAVWRGHGEGVCWLFRVSVFA